MVVLTTAFHSSSSSSSSLLLLSVSSWQVTLHPWMEMWELQLIWSSAGIKAHLNVTHASHDHRGGGPEESVPKNSVGAAPHPHPCGLV